MFSSRIGTFVSQTFFMSLLAILSLSSSAQEKSKDGATLNLKADSARKFEANQSQIGYASTKIFYTFNDRKIVVMIHIDNEKEDFPIQGTVYQFGKNVTEEGLAKWLNNQHSDGLFPDVPEPIKTHKLGEDTLKIVSSKSQEKVQAGIGNYEKFSVKFKVAATNVSAAIKLKECEETTTVFRPIK